MKLFVTGAAGFLGSHLAEAFIRQGHEVAGCDNLIGGERENLPEGIRFEVADCGEVALMKRLSSGADVIYHCAAIAPESYSVFAPAIIARHVYQNTAGILAATASNGAKRFVFCSSMARYGAGRRGLR